MQRVIVKVLGGPEHMVVELFPDLTSPAAGEVLVDVEAAGVNFLDINLRKGAGVHAVPAPFTPGLEGVGRVRAVGEGVALLPGQRVAWMNARGSYASQLVLRAELVVTVPETLAAPQALIFQAMTAQSLRTNTAPSSPATACWCMPPPGASGSS